MENLSVYNLGGIFYEVSFSIWFNAEMMLILLLLVGRLAVRDRTRDRDSSLGEKV